MEALPVRAPWRRAGAIDVGTIIEASFDRPSNRNVVLITFNPWSAERGAGYDPWILIRDATRTRSCTKSVPAPANGGDRVSIDESEPDTAYEAVLNDHYGVGNLVGEIVDALEAAGKDIDALTRADIASFDEFHIRGLEATREVAGFADIGDHARVLDVGCGVGGPARTLAAEYDCEVVGIDVVEEYCRAATLFTDLVGLTDDVSFHHGNALDLPFEAESFDTVWFEHTLMNIEAKAVAFDEARRVLRPSGRLALYEICAGPGGATVFPVPWASDASLSYLVRPDGLRDLAIDAGFDEVVWRDVTGPSLEWFSDVVESMQSRPPDAPQPLGLNLLMGAETPVKAANVVRNLEEDRIAVVQAVYERVGLPTGASSGKSTDIKW